MERSKDFVQVVQAPIIRNIEREDLDEIKEEILLFACPWCGHIMPDHKWTEPMTCLRDNCTCSWWDDESPKVPDDNHYFDVELLKRDIQEAWANLPTPI